MQWPMQRLLPALAAALLAAPFQAGPFQAAPVQAAAPDSPQPPGSEQASPAANPQEQQMLDRIKQLKGEQWRSFGACRYAWARWRMGENGVRITQLQCGPDFAEKGIVAVHCDTLRINRKIGEAAWETWRLPLSSDESSSSGGEDRMVAALCANLKPVPTPTPAPPPEAKPSPAKPAPSAPPEAKPAPAKPAT
jgi:hypothetical protein